MKSGVDKMKTCIQNMNCSRGAKFTESQAGYRLSGLKTQSGPTQRQPKTNLAFSICAQQVPLQIGLTGLDAPNTHDWLHNPNRLQRFPATAYIPVRDTRHGRMEQNGLLRQDWCESMGRVDRVTISHGEVSDKEI